MKINVKYLTKSSKSIRKKEKKSLRFKKKPILELL